MMLTERSRSIDAAMRCRSGRGRSANINDLRSTSVAAIMIVMSTRKEDKMASDTRITTYSGIDYDAEQTCHYYGDNCPHGGAANRILSCRCGGPIDRTPVKTLAQIEQELEDAER